MKKFTYIFIFLSFSSLLNSQVCGYLGKRAVITYNMYVTPNIIAMFGGEGPYLNVMHEGEFAYSYNNKSLIGFGIRSHSFQITNNDDASVNEYIKYKNLDYSLYFDFLRSGWVAPLGKYIRLGLRITQLRNEPYMYHNDNYNTVLITSSTSKYTPGFLFGYGARRVKFNRLVVGLGVDFATFYPIASTKFLLSDYEYEGEDTNFNNALIMLQLYSICNVKLSIGLLPF